jgi:hypothetical protein
MKILLIGLVQRKWYAAGRGLDESPGSLQTGQARGEEKMCWVLSAECEAKLLPSLPSFASFLALGSHIT